MVLIEFESRSSDHWDYEDALYKVNDYLEDNGISDSKVIHLEFIRQSDNHFDFILATKLVVTFE